MKRLLLVAVLCFGVAGTVVEARKSSDRIDAALAHNQLTVASPEGAVLPAAIRPSPDAMRAVPRSTGPFIRSIIV